MKKQLISFISLAAVIAMLSSCIVVIDKSDDKTDGDNDGASWLIDLLSDDDEHAGSSVGAYRFLCIDNNSFPVEGVSLKIVSDSISTLAVTDTDGCVVYPAVNGKCEVSVMSYPDGYVLADDVSITADNDSEEYVLRFDIADDGQQDTEPAETSVPASTTTEHAESTTTASETVPPETTAVPTSATAAAGDLTAELNGNNVLLKWNKVSGADAYRVYMCDETGGSCHSLVRTLDTDYTVKGLEEGKTYIFKVASLEKDGGFFSETGIVGEVQVVAGVGVSAISEAVTTAAATTAATTTTPTAAAAAPTWNTYDFAIYDENGKRMMLSDFAGKPVIINVWATWCGYCVNELPSFEDLYEKYGSQVQFIMLNCDGESVSSYVKRNGYTFPVYYDNDYSSSRYFGDGIPVTAAITAQGELEVFYEGAASSSQLEAAVKTILGSRRGSQLSSSDRRIKTGETEPIKRQ